MSAKPKKQMVSNKDHGLGIGKVEAAKVLKLEATIYDAAVQAHSLGVSFETFVDLSEGAMDVASSR